MIIAISGKQGSGKSTLLRRLVQCLPGSVMTVKFADPLYEMHNEVLRIAKNYGIDAPVKDGRLLQLLGTEWGRKMYGEGVWVDAAFKKIDNLGSDFVIIDDCRFKNELFAVKKRGGLVFRLEATAETRKLRCEGWRDAENHPSETDLDDLLYEFTDVINSQDQDSDTVLSRVLKEIFKRR